MTKFFGPVLITATAGGVYLGGRVEGGWRLIPVIYAVALVVMAVVVWAVAPRQDRKPGRAVRSVRCSRPLRDVRVWRFSLYYVAVFGAYVALAAWLPKYYVTVYGLELQAAALLTALFIFPASLLRPLGGWMSDRFGARRLMYFTFGLMLTALLFLAAPFGYIVLDTPEGTREVMPYSLGVVPFTVLVFLVGVAMGIGKAAVYKHIPEYFPHDVGAVGGLVGMLGALGGFLLPPLFVAATGWVGIPQATFMVLFVLTAVCAIWMHLTVDADAPPRQPRAEPTTSKTSPLLVPPLRQESEHVRISPTRPPTRQGVALQLGPRERRDLGLPARLADAGDHHLRADAGVLHVVPGQRLGADPDQPRVRPQQGPAVLAGGDAQVWPAARCG